MVSDNMALRGLLEQLGESPQVRAAMADVSGAVRAVRFSTGLRRSWREARTEASVQCVRATLAGHGLKIDAKQLREQIVERGEPTHWKAAAAWRAHADVIDHLPPLNTRDAAPTGGPSAVAMLARLRRDAASTHPNDLVRERAGIALGPAGDKERLLADIADTPGPAIVVLSVLIGQWLSDPPGLEGDEIVRDAMVRFLATTRGFEPTGTAVISTASLLPSIDLYTRGTGEAMDAWISEVARTYVEAMTGALAISQSILAGRTDPSLG